LLATDKGYEAQGFRRQLRQRGIRLSIPQREWADRRRKPGRPPTVHPASAWRWIVERTPAWMDDWRRLVVRWERHVDIYRAFLVIACFMTCVKATLGIGSGIDGVFHVRRNLVWQVYGGVPEGLNDLKDITELFPLFP